MLLIHEANYAHLTKADVYAIKAVAEGKGDPHQQVDALNKIILDICETYDSSYRPPIAAQSDGMAMALAMAFLEGRRSVGLQIRRIVAQPMKMLVPDDPKAPKADGDLKE